MLFLTSCLSFSLSSCKRRNGRARAHAIRTCRYSNMFEKQNSLYRLKKGAECEMEQALGISYTPKGVRRGTYALVRYADDLVIFSPTHEKAVEAQHLLSTWLGTRGLRLSGEKTHIRYLREGFNFLGFNIRHYPTPNSSRSGYKLLIKPSPDSIRQIKRKLKA